MVNTQTYSDFWSKDLGEIPEPEKGFTRNLIELAAYRRVISNFVCILTNKTIPVRFSSGDEPEGLTDGKCIWLSAAIRRKKDFDWSVGIALHEAAHIKLSDFDEVKRVFASGITVAPNNIIEKAKEKKVTKDQLAYLCKWVFNVVEDRYIDSFIFSDAPGYRGYYKSMYEKLWNSDSISEGIKSEAYRVPNLLSYEFRIVNFTNPHTDLNALPGLKEIAEIFDISNILRLKTTRDRLEVSYKIVYLILCNIRKQPKGTEISGTDATIQQLADMLKKAAGNSKGKGQSTPPKEEEKKDEPIEFDPVEKEESGESEGDEEGDDEPEEPEDLDKVVKNQLNRLKGNGEESDGEEPIGSSDKGDTSDLSKQQIKDIEKQFEKQRKLLQHDYRDVKECVSSSDAKLLEVIENVGIVMMPAHFQNEHQDVPSKVDCIVVHKLTKELIQCGKKVFPMAAVEIAPGNDYSAPIKYEDAINRGFTLGRALGKKLQIRGETTVTKFIRKFTGKIERRLLPGIGAGQEDIFHKTLTTRYNRLRLHISVDASDSMIADSKWCPTMTCVTAICVAASMTENLEVSVSFRLTHRLGDGMELPYIVLAYDSSVDKIQKIKSLFPFLGPSGCTPEGLAFEATMNKFIIGKRTDEQDHYFVNISDGEPFYNMSGNQAYSAINYRDDTAISHTKKQVDKIRKQDVKVLSYFIESDDNLLGFAYHSTKNLRESFSKMYGKDAKFIDVTSVFDIAKTMNHLFLYGE